MNWPEAVLLGVCFSLIAGCVGWAFLSQCVFTKRYASTGTEPEVVGKTAQPRVLFRYFERQSVPHPPFEPILRVQRLTGAARLPAKAHATDAGFDVWALNDVVLKPGERVAVPTGLSIAVPEGYYVRIAPRSGHAVKGGIAVLAGTVDCSYRGEVVVVLINHGSEPYTIPQEKAIAQLIVEACYGKVQEVASLDETERATGGFGSTDKLDADSDQDGEC